MAERQEEKKGGCLGRLLVLFVLVLLVAFAAALFFIALPQDMGAIPGYAVAPPPNGRDLTRVLENSIKGGHALTLTEAEVNAYLKRTLVARQNGLLAPWVELRGAAVRFHPGHAEVVLERTISGRPFTLSMFVSIDQTETPDGRITTYVNKHGGPYHPRVSFLNRGGRFGRLVVPQGFLILVIGSFERLAQVYPRELDLACKEMARIKIEQGKLVLDPNPPDRAGFGTF